MYLLFLRFVFLVSVTLGMTKVKKKNPRMLILESHLKQTKKKSLFLAYVQMTSRTHKYKIELISNLTDD